MRPDKSTVSDKIRCDTLPKGTFLMFWRLQKAKIKLPLSLPPPLPHPVPTMLCSCSSYNRGQKCWELSSDFIKTSEFPLLHQTTLILSEKGRNEPFLGAQHCWERGVWDEGMKPKPIKTLIVMEQSPMQLFLV